MKLVKCEHCGYQWHTASTLIKITCPSCGKKTANVKAMEVKA